MDIALNTLAPTQIYHLMTQAIIPRPIAWVLTESAEDNYNVAPFSYFTPVASNPPLLMFSVGKKPSGEIKDTTRNALETGKMVVHIASAALSDQVTQSAATLDHGVSEVEAGNIKLCEFEGFELPRIKACPIALGCTLYEIKEIGETPQSLVFAQIETIYIDENVIDSDSDRLKISALKVDPLSRLGGGEYSILKNVFSVKRPD